MRIFVTGASGWIGSAVLSELLGAGHEVIGLARSDASAEAITAAGAEARRGDIGDLDVLRAAAAESDGVVHLAFRHDIAFAGDVETAVASDRAAIEALGEVLASSDRPLAVASGVAGVKPGTLATERDFGEAFGGPGGRVLNERMALDLADRGVRSMSVRFAPTVHGAGDNGFVAMVVASDRTAGAAA
jgi:nucleoside-diphosphate-sugar epimerase